ncbi:ABC transporter substrate-binding protein [Streptomyces sannanensis]|uniref:ABC transporter substrate-binding protein n=1 Tax=Streptomyces sannanensis TaxID=285536 RepID=A0ABP6S6D4_9ACTN
MFNRTSLQAIAALASISLLAGCGLLPGGGSDAEQKIIVGSTSVPSTLDPAASWDGSWELFRNVFQTLLSFPTGSTTPQPDAAKKCEFTDASNKTFQCMLREGLKFSDGERLDAEAVKHSIDRIVKIDVKAGPKGLLGSLDRVETEGESTVTFHLNKADATFPFVLATPAMSIVAPKEYPADRLREDDRVTGSGPYVLKSYDPDSSAELAANHDYKGFAKRRNEAVTIRYFKESGALMQALEAQQIDLTYRGLTAEEVLAIEDRQGKEKEGETKLQLIETVGSEIRFLVFNPKDPAAGNPAVRKAVAQVIDRDALVAKAYMGTAEPLYSMIPKGVAGHTTPFFDSFGSPSAEKAGQILREAGINEPVALTLWYTTDRYGSSTKPEFEEIRRQLEDSKLFKVTLKSRPTWKEYTKGFQQGEFPVFGRGWNPDFPDPDNFIAPFVGKENAVGTPYEQREILDELLPKSRRQPDRGAVSDQFHTAQKIIAKDVRLLPLWQGKTYIAASDEIAGGERALDPQTVMQMWELHRKTSW